MGYLRTLAGHGWTRHRDTEDQRGGRQTGATIMKDKPLGLDELF